MENRFSEISCEPNVSFYGNIEVGKDISVEQLKKHFPIIIFAYGCSTPKRLNIEGFLTASFFPSRFTILLILKVNVASE